MRIFYTILAHKTKISCQMTMLLYIWRQSLTELHQGSAGQGRGDFRAQPQAGGRFNRGFAHGARRRHFQVAVARAG